MQERTMAPRVVTETCYMMDIIADVRRGHVVPAAFQRPYVWTVADIEALWMSILKGYPLGSLLMWNPIDAMGTAGTRLGPIQVVGEGRRDIILDGQNRLVTMAWSMTPTNADVTPDAPGHDIWRSGRTLVADPYRNLVRFVDDDDVTGMIMPIHHLSGTFNTFLRKNWKSAEDDVHAEWLDALGELQRSSRMIKVTIERATPAQARDAFLHISRVGVPMGVDDFDAAMVFDLENPT